MTPLSRHQLYDDLNAIQKEAFGGIYLSMGQSVCHSDTARLQEPDTRRLHAVRSRPVHQDV